MKFKNYCVIILGNVDGVNDEITNISETEVKFIKVKGLVVGTFSSVATSSELKDYFKSFGRDFFLFELDKNSYGAHLNDGKIYQHLFGEYDNDGDVLVNELTTKLFKSINKGLSGGTTEQQVNIEIMSDVEKNSLLDKMLDKGVDNWSDIEKKLIKKLSKN